MKTPRLLASLFIAGALAVSALAADPSGTWKWTTQTPNGDIATTLKLESKDGKLTGAYSNQFGSTTISNPSLKDDVIAFDVERDFDGTKFVLKYQGKLQGDTIKGVIHAPGFDGGEGMKLDWNASRVSEQKPADTKAKSES